MKVETFLMFHCIIYFFGHVKHLDVSYSFYSMWFLFVKFIKFNYMYKIVVCV